MNELIGYVLGNRQRERIMGILVSRGAITQEKIAKLERLPAPAVSRVLQELEEKDLVTRDGEAWKLTETGSQVEKEMKKRT
ncbi:MAG: MarR family transcriptional regulator [Methanotrichaceae archaeon]|nr:MarR family transcriptional regulator [Methanotrichaceae archaeon]